MVRYYTGRLMKNFTVNRLSPVLGAEMIGADLSHPLEERDFAAIRNAWLEANGIMVFRDQDLSPDQHIAFSRRFGPLEKHVMATYLLPGYPEIYRVSNKVTDGVPQGRAKAGTYWHSDLSYMTRRRWPRCCTGSSFRRLAATPCSAACMRRMTRCRRR
jgi:taurine dioxygenase